MLRPLILDRDHNSRRNVRQPHCAVSFVHVLTACPSCPKKETKKTSAKIAVKKNVDSMTEIETNMSSIKYFYSHRNLGEFFSLPVIVYSDIWSFQFKIDLISGG